MDDQTTDFSMTTEQLLNLDLKMAGKNLGKQEARFLVDTYYTLQKDRIRFNNQIRAIGESGEPIQLLTFLSEHVRKLEGDIKVSLDVYTFDTWLRSVRGIGPVIAAGLMAHLDIEQAPTVGHFWSFAGLDPTKKWEKGQRRPWNATLKTLCWKAGESFVKFQDGYYGQIYVERKKLEWDKNLSGDFGHQAADILRDKRFDKTKDAYKWYVGRVTVEEANRLLNLPKDAKAEEKKAQFLTEDNMDEGMMMLPPGHIHARAKRYAVKLFLAHYHEVLYRERYGKAPPLPYPIVYQGHAHVIRLPEEA